MRMDTWICVAKSFYSPPETIIILSIGYCCCCSIAKLCPTLCDLMDSSKPGFLVFHCLLEFAQTYVHSVSDAIQPSHPLSPPSPLAFNLSPHQGLFQWVSPLHQVAKVLELQLHHQSFQWMSGLISFSIDCFDLLLSKGFSRVVSYIPILKIVYIEKNPDHSPLCFSKISFVFTCSIFSCFIKF